MMYPHAAAVVPVLLRIAIIVVVTLVTYLPVYRGDWLWDDNVLLTDNPAVQSGSLAGLVKLWVNPSGVDYFPLAYTALWMQWQLFGKDPTGYHVTSVLLHVASALLLWRLLDRMRIPGGWLAGLLFAVHPVCVESVAWIAEIKNTLSLPLFLLAAISWVEQDEAARPADWLQSYGLSLVFFLLSLLAKPAAIAMPMITLVHAWWRRNRITTHDLLRAAPMFAIALLIGGLTVLYQQGRAIGDQPIAVGGLGSRTALAGMAILHYLASIAWPVNLLPIYPRWQVDPPKAWQFLAWVPIVATAAWGWADWSRHRGSGDGGGWGRHVLFAGGFFLLTAAPVLGFVTIAYMAITWVADHFIYLPITAIVALACAVVADWHRRSRPAVRRALECGAVLVVCLCVASSYRYAAVWRDEEALWTYTLEHNPDAWMAHARLGSTDLKTDQLDAALRHFEMAVRLRPDLSMIHTYLGIALSRLDRHDESIRAYEQALRLATPSAQADAAAALGVELITSGRPARAERIFRDLAERFPHNHIYVNNHAAALVRVGDRAGAIRQFRRALALKPGYEPASVGLARTLRDDSARPAP